MNCLACKHWTLEGSPLRAEGFGTCAAITDPVRRAGQTYSPDNRCRVGAFERAPAAVLAQRAKEGAPPR